MQENKFEELRALSYDKHTKLYQCIWGANINKPRAIVQICHGMSEYIGRYEEFAQYLVSKGCVVCGHDQVGHGKSINSDEDRGHLPKKIGKDIFIEDTHLLRLYMQKRFGNDVPYFLFGHSMGSFIVRCYVSYYGEGLSGAIVCATGHISPFVSRAGRRLCRIIGAFRGERYISKTLDSMGAGGYSKKLDNPKTPLDWLSYNDENVQEYLNDNQAGFIFTCGGFDALTSLTLEIATQKCNSRIPKDLPMFFIAGDGDPVGDFGKGFNTAVALARDAGVKDIEAKLYEHMRHELLKEHDKQLVMDDIEAWIDKHI